MVKTLPELRDFLAGSVTSEELQALDIHVPAFATWYAEMAALGANVQLGRRVRNSEPSGR